MKLLEETIHEQIPRMKKFILLCVFIGDRSRLPSHLVALMEDAAQQTVHHDAMTLTIAISYGGMWDIANAAKEVAQQFLVVKLTLIK